MKTILDPRHKIRQEIVKELFAESFHKQPKKSPKVKEILELLPQIDAQIEIIAPEYPIEKINRVDLAILRLGVYELTIDKSQPIKVIIDEEIELAKEFGNESSAAFINGALGKLIKSEKENGSTTV